MQTTFEKIIEGIGAVIFMIGMMAAESENLLYPIGIMLVGGILFYFGSRKDEYMHYYENFGHEEDEYDD